MQEFEKGYYNNKTAWRIKLFHKPVT